MALAAMSYKVCPRGLGGMARGGWRRGLVVRAVSAHWLDNGEIFCLPVAYIKASSSFICTYIDLRGFLE